MKKPKPPTQQELIMAVLKKHQVTKKRLATDLGVSSHTVKAWLAPPEWKAARTMGEPMKRLMLALYPLEEPKGV